MPGLRVQAVIEPLTASEAPPCGCGPDAHGYTRVCAEHEPVAQHFEARLRWLLDRELDDVVRELAGRAPQRLERKPGATGDFAVTRSKPGEVR